MPSLLERLQCRHKRSYEDSCIQRYHDLQIDVRYVSAQEDDKLTLFGAILADLWRSRGTISSAMSLLLTEAAGSSKLAGDSGVSAFGLGVT